MHAERQVVLPLPAPPAALSASAGTARLPVAAPAGWYGLAKRVLDVAFAAVLLVLTSPGLALACALVFYTKTRIGRGGRPFTAFHVVRPYAFQSLFFLLCPRSCAEAVTRPVGQAF